MTGDRTWLDDSFRIIQNSIRDDEQVVYDSNTGLFHGETSFFDWRDQTYPRWMQPADIFQSEALSTNVIYYQAYRILEKMARELSVSETEWGQSAERLRESIHRHFWIDERGIYGQYRYGRSSMVLSPRVDALGCALACVFAVADDLQRRQIIKNLPRQIYGTPVVYPQSAGVAAYHNESVWPFVESFCMIAASRVADEGAVTASVAALTRAAALFQTNKENFVLATGDARGTVVNSDRQLWSVAGMLAMTYRLLFGMRFEPEGLYLEPFVPKSLAGMRRLTRFPYRKAMLTIEVHGHGRKIRSSTIDGHDAAPMVPSHLEGEHSIIIHLESLEQALSIPRLFPEETAPETPEPVLMNGTLHWAAIPGAEAYLIFENGLQVKTVQTTECLVSTAATRSVMVQVAALAANGSSYLSAPVYVGVSLIEIKPAAGETLEQDPASPFPFVTSQGTSASSISFSGVVPSAGVYKVTCIYANGSGPIETGNKCAIRSLYVDGTLTGFLILPQRSQDDWNAWGESSALHLELTARSQKFELRFEQGGQDVSGGGNTVRLAQINLLRMS